MKRSRDQQETTDLCVQIYHLFDISELRDKIFSMVPNYSLILFGGVNRFLNKFSINYRKRMETNNSTLNSKIVSNNLNKSIIPEVLREDRVDLLEWFLPKVIKQNTFYSKYLEYFSRHGTEKLVKWVFNDYGLCKNYDFTQFYIYAAQEYNFQVIKTFYNLGLCGPGPFISDNTKSSCNAVDQENEIEFCLYLTKKTHNTHFKECLEWLIEKKFCLFYITSSLFFNTNMAECKEILIKYGKIYLDTDENPETFHEINRAEAYDEFLEHVKIIENLKNTQIFNQEDEIK
jgi:hypothetical protein